MSSAYAAQPVLIDRLWPARADAGRAAAALRWTVLAVVGSVLLTASAKASVPMWPIPMTMQSFAVLVIGMAYGWRLAGATVLLYLAQGAAGLPVFAGTPALGIGIPYMLGTTGGFLAGFLVAALAVGWLAEKGWDRSLFLTVVALMIGSVLLFAPGILWLATFVGWDRAIAAGVVPFVPGQVLKIALAAAVLPLAWRALGERELR